MNIAKFGQKTGMALIARDDMTHIEQVLKEFDEQFVIFCKESCRHECCKDKKFSYLSAAATTEENLKSFITKALQDQAEKHNKEIEELREAVNLIQYSWYEGRDRSLDAFDLKRIEQLNRK